MLRIIQSKGVGQAKSYYAQADYYLEGQELAGRWRGEGARLLGLEGDVGKSEWDKLCDNIDPRTGKRLTLRTDADRTVGYDFNFHVPKSISLLYATTRDERILNAFRDSVGATMQDIESEMTARVRKGGRNEERKTGNMVWGEFIHFTSRPVDGIPDPHLHAHCFGFNVTRDEKEQAWKAGQFREIKRDAPYFEALFHARLAHSLSDLGLPIARTKKGWELAGVGKGLIDRFSRRTKQIEDKAREMGIDDPHAKDELGARTRESKQKDLSFSELQDTWRGRMTPQEIDALKTLERRIGGDSEPQDGNAAARALEFAIGHEFERKSVTPERQLLATALRRGAGSASAERILDEAKRSDLIVGQRHGRRMATTRDVLEEEKRVIDFVRKGRGACEPFVRGVHAFKRDRLNDGQRKAVAHILGSRDRVTAIRGAAGVGKTTLLSEAVEAIEEMGTKVFAFAPSAQASDVLREEGFHGATTVARLLVDERLQREAAGQLVLVDEVGLLGMRTLDELFALAQRHEWRLLFSGDRHQHGSVERGAALKLLEEEAGLKPAEVKEIQRQSGDYKSAVKAISEGRLGEGFARLDQLKWIHEIPGLEREGRLAADYLDAVKRGKTALVIAPTHVEGERITKAIRGALREKRKLKGEEREFRVLENANLTEAERGDAANYLRGDVIQFHQNAKGFGRGEKVRVDGDYPLPLEHAASFQAFHSRTISFAPGDMLRITRNGLSADPGKHKLNNGALYRIKRFDDRGNIILQNGWTIGREYGHLDHGYVVTSHASQGRTVDEVFVGQSRDSLPASSAEQFYVSTSRGKKRVTIYTDDKEALREAIMQSDDRLSATEFVNGKARQLTVDLRRRERDFELTRESREREVISHAR
jgi:conjugative relaxase-like TrwC/TraI family protein